MITLPNILSFLRVPLAFCFVLSQDAYIRSIVIVVAMISDGLDGFLARRYHLSSKFGTVLDPATDRFFTYVATIVFLKENSIDMMGAFLLIWRDIVLAVFCLYLTFKGKLMGHPIRSIWCGKITTFLQFIIFIALTFGMTIPFSIYLAFFVLGILAFVELLMINAKAKYSLSSM